jgi:hypothetical protein
MFIYPISQPLPRVNQGFAAFCAAPLSREGARRLAQPFYALLEQAHLFPVNSISAINPVIFIIQGF